MSDIKLCPFCGEYPKFYGATDGSGFEAIDCINDNCLVSPTTDYMNYEDALKAWNTRAAPKFKKLEFTGNVVDGFSATCVTGRYEIKGINFKAF